MASCSRCRKSAVTLIRYNGARLCANHFNAFVEERVKREVRRQCRIGKGEKIAVGLSGGKDSGVSLYLVKKIFTGRMDLSISAITVDEGIKGYRDKTIKAAKKLCDRLDVEHHVVSFHNGLGHTLDDLSKMNWDSDEFAPCTFCGVFRRFFLNETARSIGATRLATGLNLDDTAQSVLMNIARGDVDKLARMGPHTVIRDGLVPRIQPLRTIPEKETYLYAVLNEIEFDHSECPYAQSAQRNRFRELVAELEDRTPGTRQAALMPAFMAFWMASLSTPLITIS
jgi:tRNA(Ile)-lysidine synthase TilS/MesJ